MYHPVYLKLSKARASKLTQGQSIKISSADVVGEGSGVMVPLTMTQHKKLAQGAFILKLSNAQLRYMHKHGSGFMDIFKKALPVVAPTILDLTRQGLNKGVDFVVNKAGEKINDFATGKGFFDSMRDTFRANPGPLFGRGASDLTEVHPLQQIQAMGKSKGRGLRSPGF